MSHISTVITALDPAIRLQFRAQLDALGRSVSAKPDPASANDRTVELPPGGGHVFDDPIQPDTPGGTEETVTTQPLPPMTVRTFGWGFHVEVPHDTLEGILDGSDIVGQILSMLAPVTGPAAPFVGAFATFISTAAGVCRVADFHGKGIFVSMLWFVPGVFVPTPVT